MKIAKILIVAAVCLGIAWTVKTAVFSEKGPAAGTTRSAPKPGVAMASNAWQVPFDVNQTTPPPSPTPTPPPTQTDWLNFGWQTFVALNWPAVSQVPSPSQGQPDVSQSIGAVASNGALLPTVWLTYRDLSTVMLVNGADPGQPYSTNVPLPSNCGAIGSNPVAPGFQPMFIDGSTWGTFQHPESGLRKDYVNQASNNPLVSQNGWYTIADILLDQSEYTYIQQNGYFKGLKQVADMKASGELRPFPRTGSASDFSPPVTLPSYAQYGALEVKATWRVLDPVKDQNVIPRYYTQWGYFRQLSGSCNGPTLFGLVALHILRLTPTTPGTWFWATFEQVDNTSGGNPSLAVSGTPNGNCSASGPGSPYNVGPALVTTDVPWNNSNTADNICQVTTIPANVQNVNQSWQQQLKGTVWQYYQMDNTLNPCPSGTLPCYTFPPLQDQGNQVNTADLANTAVESYFQQTTDKPPKPTSCMSCHGFADAQGTPSPFTGTNQIFTFVLQNAYNPIPSLETQKLLKTFRAPGASKIALPKGNAVSDGDGHQRSKKPGSDVRRAPQ